jgi:hypothetical protein
MLFLQACRMGLLPKSSATVPKLATLAETAPTSAALPAEIQRGRRGARHQPFNGRPAKVVQRAAREIHAANCPR